MSVPLTSGERRVLTVLRETTGLALGQRMTRLRAVGLDDQQIVNTIQRLIDLGLVDPEEEPP